MTSSQLIRMQQLDAEIEEARKASNLVRMQELLTDQTALLASIYGRPNENAGP